MPTYDVQNKLTGEVKEIFCSYKDKKKALKELGPSWRYLISSSNKAAKKVAKKTRKKTAPKQIIQEDEDEHGYVPDLLEILPILLVCSCPGLILAGLIFGFSFLFGDEATSAVGEVIEHSWWVILVGGLIYGTLNHFSSGGSSPTDYHANDSQFDGD